MQVTTNWALEAFGECSHDRCNLVRAQTTERVGDIGNVNFHGFALLAKFGDFLHRPVGYLHQVECNFVTQLLQLGNCWRKWFDFAMYCSKADHVDARFVLGGKHLLDSEASIGRRHHIFCIHHHCNSDGCRNFELFEKLVSRPRRWAKVSVGFDLPEAHLDDIDSSAHHRVDIMGNNVV